MNDTITTQDGPNIPRLLDLGRWLTQEERNRRLGKPSHWNQSVWVEIDADDELPIEVAGSPGGDQPPLIRWSCGTAACAAGHISLEDDGRPAFTNHGELSPVPPDDADDDLRQWLDHLSSSFMYFDGRLESIEEHAQRALGLTTDQARSLFHADNQWDIMVGRIAEYTDIPVPQLLAMIGGLDMPADPDDGYEDSDDDDPCDCGCQNFA